MDNKDEKTALINNPMLSLSTNDRKHQIITSFWRHSGKLDLARRYLLSATKTVNIFNVTMSILRGLYLISEHKSRLPSIQIATLLIFFSGGFVEPILSMSARRNKTYLPSWNAAISLLENFLLKFASTGLLFCPLQEIPNKEYPTFLPDKRCVAESINYLGIASPALFGLAMITAAIEYLRYKNTFPNNNASSTCLARTMKYIKSSVFLNCLSSFVNAMVGTMGLMEGMNFFILLRLEVPFTREIILPISAFTGLINGSIEYCERKEHHVSNPPTKKKKIAYYTTELLRPSLSNIFGINYLFSTFLILFRLHDLGSNAVKIIYGSLILLTTLFICKIRADDSYKYKFNTNIPQRISDPQNWISLDYINDNNTPRSSSPHLS